MSAEKSSKEILDYGYSMMELWVKNTINQTNIDDKTFQWAMDMALKHYKIEKEADTNNQIFLFRDKTPEELEQTLEALEQDGDES